MSSRTFTKKHRTVALAALVGVALVTPALAASLPNDAWITTKVKLSLFTTEGVGAAAVSVDTVDRRVTLYGTVHTAPERERAERTAKAVHGAQSVRNLLQVVPAKNEVAVEAKDDEIRLGVSAALAGEPMLKGSTISVQSVNKGVVLLKGNAESLSDHLTAIEIAGGIKGVRRVASEVQTPEVLADADVWKERNVAVGGSAPQTTRGAANDLYLTSMVKMRLLTNAATPAMEINVDTLAGVVTLFGIVPTDQSRLAAEAEATKTAGVTSVKNQLQVVATAQQPAVEAKDDVVQQNVKKGLERHWDLRYVAPEVKNCVARLTGHVSSGVDRVEAMQVARATRGVCSVQEELTIR